MYQYEKNQIQFLRVIYKYFIVYTLVFKINDTLLIHHILLIKTFKVTIRIYFNVYT